MRLSRPSALLAATASSMACVLILAAPAAAQSVGTERETDDHQGAGGSATGGAYEVEELVVRSAQMPGAVLGDIPPEIEIDAREIRSYGLSSVAELLDQLAPQTDSARGRSSGRPITLVNGARISSFAEIRDLPTEAIARVQIFPEEMSLKYGYRADQRVVNFILRPRFRAITAEVGGSTPTAGDRPSGEIESNVVRILKNDRAQFHVEVTGAADLRESDRNVTSRVSGGAPFDLIGNVTAVPFSAGAEIDPALSALAGSTVIVAGAPNGASGAASLSDFSAQRRITDTGQYRTLSPRTRGLSMNGLVARSLDNGVSATLNGTLDVTRSDSLLGLAETSLLIPNQSAFSPFGEDVELHRYSNALARSGETVEGHLGFAVNGAYSGWRWSLTGGADRSRSTTVTDTGVDSSGLQAAILGGDAFVDPFSSTSLAYLGRATQDRARSTTTTANVEGLVNGVVFDLPAGPVSTALTVGASTTDVSSWSLRSAVERSVSLSRDQGNVQASLDFPIASRRRGVLSALGELSANVNLAADHLSDFGTLTTTGFGANWQPIDMLRFSANFTHEEGAPSTSELGDPSIVTEGVRVFDFTRNETVEISRLSGGNPFLAADNRDVFKVGLNLKPLKSQNLSFRADYVQSRIKNVIASFPTATPQIEAAFPERFVRDADGRLLQIDSRPVNFARQEQRDFTWGFNYSRPLGPQPQRPPGGERPQIQGDGPPPAEGSQRAAASTGPSGGGSGARSGGGGGGGPGMGGPGGGMGGGMGGGFGPRMGGGRGGFMQFAVFHTIHFKDEILIRPGLEPLDLLDGAAAGNGGGQPRHEIKAQGGASKNGIGFRVTADWQSGTRVDGGATGQDLIFSDLATVDARLFADLGLQPFARGKPFWRGARVSLSVDNIFDAKQKVRTPDGATPISYQPDFLDPLGRTVKISFRKLFF